MSGKGKEEAKPQSSPPRLSSTELAQRVPELCMLMRNRDVKAVEAVLDALDPQQAVTLIKDTYKVFTSISQSRKGSIISTMIFVIEPQLTNQDQLTRFYNLFGGGSSLIHMAFYFGPAAMIDLLWRKGRYQLPISIFDFHRYLWGNKLMLGRDAYACYRTRNMEEPQYNSGFSDFYNEGVNFLPTEIVFYQACRIGCVGLVEWILNLDVGKRLNVNYAYIEHTANEVDTALCAAVRNSCAQVVTLLLRRRENIINKVTREGHFALRIAYENKDTPMMHRLLQNGANVNLVTRVRGVFDQYVGCSVLHLAVLRGELEEASRFLAWGAYINLPLQRATSKERIGILEAVCEQQPISPSLPQVVRFLLKSGIRLDEESSGRVVQILSRKIAALDEAITDKGEVRVENEKAELQITRAALDELFAHMTQESDATAPAVPVVPYDRTAVTVWSPDLIEHAHSSGAIREMVCAVFALRNREMQWRRLPLELVCAVFNRAYDATPDPYHFLRVAAQEGEEAIQAALSRPGALITCRDEDGRTLLHIAAAAGHVGAVRVLLEAGALIDAKDGVGCTAYDLADRGRHEEVQALLQEYGATVIVAPMRAPRSGSAMFAADGQSSRRDSSCPSSAPKAGGVS